MRHLALLLYLSYLCIITHKKNKAPVKGPVKIACQRTYEPLMAQKHKKLYAQPFENQGTAIT
jgi:hypothetical protein